MPRSEEQLATIPRSGEPDDYEEGSPERVLAELMSLWSRKNYGHMARLVHLPLEGVLSKKEIGPIARNLREIFQGKRLQSFQFMEISDEATAITTATLAVTYEEGDELVRRDLSLRLSYSDENGLTFRGSPGGTWTIQNLGLEIY